MKLRDLVCQVLAKKIQFPILTERLFTHFQLTMLQGGMASTQSTCERLDCMASKAVGLFFIIPGLSAETFKENESHHRTIQSS